MIKKQLITFLLRWAVSGVAMYICLNLFGQFSESAWGLRESWWFYATAGLVFSLVNTIIKPILTIFALPLLFLTLGLFTLVLNAAMVALTVWLIPGVSMGWVGALGSCIVISVLNFLVNLAVPVVK